MGVLAGQGQGQSPNPLTQPTAQAAPPLHVAMGAQHEQAAAQFSKMNEVKSQLDATTGALARLAKMGNAVTAEDVIKTAGDLVATGHAEPLKMAGLLADMPQGGGQALAAWVGQHVQQMGAIETQFNQAHAVARHEMGLSAIRSMAAHAVAGGPAAGAAEAAQAPPSSNGLGTTNG